MRSGVAAARGAAFMGLLLACAASLGAAGSRGSRGVSPRFTPPALGDILAFPESERTWRRLVIGLDPNRTRYFMLPSTERIDPKSRDPRVRHLRRQLYWLNFELVRGGLMKAAPPHTRFYVALPDPEMVPESIGNEEDVFRDYLATRVGWTRAQIDGRVRFFKVPLTVTFPRDVAEPLGLDTRGRLVLGIGEDDKAGYREVANRLVQAFPDEFVLRELPEVDVEGGDIELVSRPGGGLGVLVGHNRARRWIEQRHGTPTLGRPIPQAQIDEARYAFSRAFLGLPAFVVTEGDLLHPHRVSEELFHLDMTVNVVRVEGKVIAFVPTYVGRPTDAITHVPLAPEVRSRLQRSWNSVAAQMSSLGFTVERLPFSDHPVRTPVNVGKFRDPVTGQQVILLGKYPYHFPLPPDRRIPQFQLQEAFDRLEAAVESWHASSTEARWGQVTAALEDAWRAMDRAAAEPNPTAEAQVAVYEKAGVRVVLVPMYPTGEGGLHCLSLARGPRGDVRGPGASRARNRFAP